MICPKCGGMRVRSEYTASMQCPSPQCVEPLTQPKAYRFETLQRESVEELLGFWIWGEHTQLFIFDCGNVRLHHGFTTDADLAEVLTLTASRLKGEA